MGEGFWGFLDHVFSSLARWPIVEGAVAICILAFAAYLIRSGWKEKPAAEQQTPAASGILMMAHDALAELRRLGEQSRAANELLGRVERLGGSAVGAQREMVGLLEDIRNNQELRTEIHRPARGPKRL